MFDPQALAKLSEDMKDAAFARSFAEKYRGLLGHRVNRITSALEHADLVSAMDATLSLKVSSSTVGTCELAELAWQIELDVRAADARAAKAKAERLPDAMNRADAALTAYLAAA